MSETLPVDQLWRVSEKLNAAAPPHWSIARLGELVGIQNGLPLDSSKFNKTHGFPVIRIRDVGRPDTLTMYSGEVDREFVVHDGDVIVGMDGEFRCRFWRGRSALLNQRVCRLTPNEIYANKNLIAFFLQLHLNEIEKATSSVTVKHLSSKTIANIPFALPPLPEQQRIVAKLDELMAASRRARAALDALPEMLEQYRRSVLGAAVSGDLTINWRSQTNSNVADTGSGRLANSNAEVLRKKNIHRSWDPDAEQGQWQENELPPTWQWRTFEQCFRDLTSSDLKLPQSEYAETGALPVVDQGASFPGGRSDRVALAFSGPLPVIVFGDHTRRAHFVDSPFIQGADGTKVLAPRPTIVARYAWRMLQAIRLPDKGYSRHFKFLRASRFPVPPVQEQEEIAGRVDGLFVGMEVVRAHVAEQRAALDALDRAILDKAFRGELVPQDPSDEPASVMLARLRAERAAQVDGKPARKRRSGG